MKRINRAAREFVATCIGWRRRPRPLPARHAKHPGAGAIRAWHGRRHACRSRLPRLLLGWQRAARPRCRAPPTGCTARSALRPIRCVPSSRASATASVTALRVMMPAVADMTCANQQVLLAFQALNQDALAASAMARAWAFHPFRQGCIQMSCSLDRMKTASCRQQCQSNTPLSTSSSISALKRCSGKPTTLWKQPSMPDTKEAAAP